MTDDVESDSTSESSPAKTSPHPSLGDMFLVWLKIGLLSFGGPAAQISLMHRFVVEEKGWLSEKQYLNALSFCMLLPGPEAMQLATYAGWRLHGVAGGLMAGLLFVVPGALVVLLLALVYALYGSIDWVGAAFLGVKAAVIIIVVQALRNVARRTLAGPEHWVIAALAFVGLFFLNLPYPLIVLAAAVYGFWFWNPGASRQGERTESSITPADHHSTEHLAALQPARNTIKTVVVCLVIWAMPLVASMTLTSDRFLFDIGRFFSQLAVVTFGGAYAVLAYLAQDVVSTHGWLTAGEMMDGLGLAETTPGPLILVTEFVGFMAGFRHEGVSTGLLAAAMTLWVTFVPCFLWIFAGAPYIDWIGSRPRLKSALSAITAAVVGVILNLSLWFALHVLFREVRAETVGPATLWWPTAASIDWLVLSLTVLCGLAVFRARWGIVRVMLASSLLGLAVHAVL